ncbi:MAG TPA: DNA primase [Dehalococcoidia bacterium]|jgi:DNA primase|nr:DNA primase [Dehalococcoidia bacterium]MDP6273835.1 DNA primase [Dehalococcoidia bacterium]MDP7214166.1 DNA primase [Dehalococcoidia bacterium]MDP7514586.1 DNA primase [Dehalococcoidia bacterium]HJM53602.1 DNA primase [Dehalococcoidia bacterium]
MTLVDDVKARSDIVQVISQYADLDTRSRTPKAPCPFHAERTASFVVFPETGTWRCFGACSTGGDVISFVMKKENLEFSDALKQLADQVGIEYRQGNRQDSSEPLYKANEIAAAYFNALLHSPEGAEARAYLEGRGIDAEAAKRRGFGMSPSGIETLAGHLKARGIGAGAAKAAGLVRQGQDGGWNDMFRGRLTIEIRDRRGQIAGFGARSMDGSEPKYLNSPRSNIFDKSGLMYGLNWAVDGISASGTVVVVEGYMDAVTAHEAGFDNTVASMGTAITTDQVGLVRGLATEVILALDGDVAGQSATRNSLETVWGAIQNQRRSGGGATAATPLEIRVATFESGKDPDEVIRGDPTGDTWRKALGNAKPLLDYLLETAVGTYDLTTPDGKARAAGELRPLINTVPNQYEQEAYMTRLAGLLDVSLEQLRVSAPRTAGARRPQGSLVREPRGSNDAVASALNPESANAPEDYLLAVVLQQPEMREYAFGANEEQFADPVNRVIFTMLKDSATLDRAAFSGEGGVADKIERLRGKMLPITDQREMVEAISDCVQRLHQRHIRRIKAEENRLLPTDGKALPDDPQQAASLAESSVETNRQLQHLFARRS